MWKRTKQFFKLVGYETKRVMRNKIVFTMLLLFSIVLLLVVSFIQLKTESYPIAIFTDGISIEEAGVLSVVNDNIKTGKITYVDCFTYF